ncbi:hypothetical protein [Thalassotalea sp. ND16A]|uniref:hypothetical protein n=1 Tax=Thalassotalea sp. ND16A TaxID=1535422 RepID=UPI00051A102E|nr:hypothetical protein [Thalassotalea sp. ND16A]KGJ95793.1 hypothetical protein ND16A_1328 [Thalassotalea sp. ND16A]
MRLSKPLYEKLPHLYFFVGVYLFYSYDEIGAIIAAVIFYFVGSVVYVKRSGYRRKNRISQTVNHMRIPDVIYEYFPFVFLAASLIFFKYLHQPLFLGAALLLGLVAIKSLILRQQSRKANPLSAGAGHKMF